MGSAEVESGLIDCGVGSIVWVRRRNGSWWPGKILRADELSATHVISPRSGTPVKLLGREDASVDWYNLEKSKRVKAFRCGEFSDCIERAEASLGMPPKKREKYARREDAILHALELERQLVVKNHGNKSCSLNTKISKASVQSKNQDGEQFHLKSHQASERDDPTLKGENKIDFCGVYIAQMQNHQIMDDDPSALHGVRGLQSKHPVSLNGDPKDPCDSNFLIEGSPRNEGIDSGDKENLLAEEGILVTKHYKRRRLVQVLQTTEKFSVSSYLQPDVSSSFVSEIEEEQSGVNHIKKARYTYLAASESGDSFGGKKIDLPSLTHEISTGHQQAVLCVENTSVSKQYPETDSPESDSQESVTDDDMATLSGGATESIEFQPKYLGRSEAPPGEHGSTQSNKLDDISGPDSHPLLEDKTVTGLNAGVRVSKWKLKGKRNNRNLVKRSLDTFDMNRFRTATYMTSIPISGGGDGSKDTSFLKNLKAPIIDRDFINGTTLVDVELKMQGSQHGQRVPMILLMSKVNSGLAIVGHPIQVEILEESVASESFSGASDVSPESLQPVWRTARRTSSTRVPRPHFLVSTGLDGAENAKPPLTSSSDCFGQKKRLTRKNIPHLAPVAKIFSRKARKRISLSSCNHQKKIKTLSSLSSRQKQTSTDLKHIFQEDGLIRPDIVSSIVACIPVKLVFSRLNEEFVGRSK
ncbi:unnamed protein product [Cuscuta epithymum]|uniref:PWWP domain-containing protein n=1 Tax=Cuscuta epithymum TaxID=186058 RepID=A0AAV0DFL1_9ASTE|nr:unnamed protein product [Cuscuta epithymum]